MPLKGNIYVASSCYARSTAR